MNSIVISGQLVADPVCRQTKTGNPTANFTLAVKRPDTADIIDHLDCAAWDKWADMAKRYRKGDWLEIEGSLTAKKVVKDDGEKRRYVEIRVKRIEDNRNLLG